MREAPTIVGHNIPSRTLYLKQREEAFITLMLKLGECEFNKMASAPHQKSLVTATVDQAQKYSQFLPPYQRDVVVKSVTELIGYDGVSDFMRARTWAELLSVILRSGTTRADVVSPGKKEAARLLPLSPFNHHWFVAHVTNNVIIKTGDDFSFAPHLADYHPTRRKVYTAIAANRDGAEICLGAEYFIAMQSIFSKDAFIYMTVPAIDQRRG